MRPGQAFGLYARVFLSKTHSKQRQLKKETLANKAAMLNTSAQDQFAKWAKLRRSVDKGLADIETTSAWSFIEGGTFTDGPTMQTRNSLPRRAPLP